MAATNDIKTSPSRRYAQAFDFIGMTARAAAPGATTARIDDVNLTVDSSDKRTVITFGHGQLSDLEDAVTNKSPTPYIMGLKADIQFYLYQKLASEGMLFTEFRLSQFLIGIERDWFPQVRLNTQFSSDTAKGLYEGLHRLRGAMSALLDGDVTFPEIAHDLEVLKTLITYYETHSHLHTPMAEVESLSLLKAAAMVWIMDLEGKKAAQASQRARLAYDNRIFEIAAEFQSQPWNRVKLPAAMSDYVALNKTESNSAKEVIRQHVELERLLGELDGRLKERWLGAWEALGSENPDAVSQAANSTVEVLTQVISRLCGEEKFEDHLKRRFPEQVAMVAALRKWIKETRDGLERVKHHPSKQDRSTAEVLMSGTEIIIKLLLRPQ